VSRSAEVPRSRENIHFFSCCTRTHDPGHGLNLAPIIIITAIAAIVLIISGSISATMQDRVWNGRCFCHRFSLRIAKPWKTQDGSGSRLGLSTSESLGVMGLVTALIISRLLYRRSSPTTRQQLWSSLSAAVARQAGLDPAVSHSGHHRSVRHFATPIGYATNLMCTARRIQIQRLPQKAFP